jgi:hypothetical protein
MKTKALRASLLLVAGIFAVSCSFTPFNKVTVRASPTLYAPLGSTDFVISDYFSAQDMASGLAGGGTGAELYTYTDPADPTVMKMLMRASLGSFQMDFTQYLDSINLDDTLNQSIPAQSMSVPAISETVDSSVTVSLTGDVMDEINSGFSTLTFPLVQTGSPVLVSASPPNVSMSSTAFTSVTFGGGTMYLDFTGQPAVPGLVFSMTNITLFDSSHNPICSNTGTYDLTVNGQRVPLALPAGAPISFPASLEFTVMTSGGTALSPYNINITPSIDPATTITGASGIDLPARDYGIPPVTIPLSALDSQFVSATVGTGSIQLSLDSLPSGIDRTMDLSISQPGGISITETIPAGAAFPYTIDLAGQNISGPSNAVTVSGVMHVSATNATISGLSAGGLDIGCHVTTSVGNFSSLVLHPAQSPNFSQSFSQALDPTMLEWISSIHFNKVGIALTVTNQLPSDIDITAGSAIFGIPTTAHTFTRSASPATFEYASSNYTLNLSAGQLADFDVSASLPGYNAGTGNLTLSNVSSGTAYSFAGTVSLIADWDSATIVANPAIQSGSYPETGGLDLSAIGTYLGSGISFPAVPAYLYLSGPAGLKTKIALNYSYTDGNGAPQTAYLAGNASGGAALDIVGALPTPFSATSVYAPAAAPGLPASSLAIDLSAPLNAHPADMRLGYTFGVDEGFTITKAMVSTVQTFGADIVIVLPFAFNVASGGAPINVPGLPVEDAGTDLFGRAQGGTATEDGNIQLLLDNLSSMELGLVLTNNTGLGLQTDFRATLADGGVFSKTLTLTNSAEPQTISLGLTADEFTRIRATNPFRPGLTFRIPEGQYAFRPSGGVTARVTVTAVTDIEQTINLGGGN